MTAEEFVPSTGDLKTLAKAAAHCQGCELYRDATRTVFGPKFRVGPSRGVPVDWQPGDAGPATKAVATVHPSSVLRAPDRDAAYAGLLADLRACAELAGK